MGQAHLDELVDTLLADIRARGVKVHGDPSPETLESAARLLQRAGIEGLKSSGGSPPESDRTG